MKKKLSNYFRINLFETCYVTSFALLCFVLFFCCYQNGIFTQPTEKDYESLHEQEEQIINDFDILYKFDNYHNYPSDDGKIIVKLTSKEDTSLSLNIIFTQDKQFISSDEISNKIGSETNKSLLFRTLSFFGFIFCLAILAMIFAFPVGGILYIFCKISQLLKKRC